MGLKVFISHRSEAKSRLGEFVTELVAADFDVWIDQPEKLDAPEEVLRQLEGLNYGEDWHAGLGKGLNRVDSVLVCLTRDDVKANPFVGRTPFREEAWAAAYAEKAIFCLFDDIDPNDLPPWVRSRHLADLRADAPGATLAFRLNRLFDQIRLKGNHAQAAVVPAETARELDEERLCLVGRSEQQSKVVWAIQEAGKNGAVSPMVVLAPENELPDLFLKRFEYRTKKLLGGAWRVEGVDWPQGLVAEFKEEYLAALADKLECGTAEADVIARLNEVTPAVAIIHKRFIDEWREADPLRVEAWVKVWADLAAAAPTAKAIPILAVKLRPARPGWQIKGEPPLPGSLRERPPRTREVWQKLAEVQARTAPPARLRVLSALQPIGAGEADTWATDLTLGAKERAVLNKLYADVAAKRVGVTHEEFCAQFRAA